MMRRTFTAHAKRVTFGVDQDLFRDRSVPQLLLNLAVLRLCTIRPLVKNTRAILKLSETIVGEHFTYNVLVRSTVFKQFCAGLDEKDIKPSLQQLIQHDVGPILDYAAEAPVDTSAQAQERTASALNVNLRQLLTASDIVYAPDDFLDANVARFVSCMKTARDNMTKSGVAFAAVKVTGLTDPQLLARISAIMLRIRQTWAEFFIPENEGHAPQLEDCRDVLGRSKGARPRRCDVEDFRAGVKRMCPEVREEQLDALIHYFDPEGNGHVHYFDYTNHLRRACVDHKHNPPELEPFFTQIPRLTPHESEMSFKADARLDHIVKTAVDLKVRVMLDAEQSYYQTAIDATVRDLQRRYNKEFPYVYNTYQGYLKFSYKRVVNDLARSRREGWIFAAKIVRGAYLETERKDALQLGYESPVHETKENTHAMYDQIAMRLMEEVEGGRRIGILFGTHNAHSLKIVSDRIVEIERRGEVEEVDVAFAQLYGMGDHLTLPLARAGHKAFKYVPYGPVKETVFYLQRRAEENTDMLRQSVGEYPLIKNELKRKLFRFT